MRLFFIWCSPLSPFTRLLIFYSSLSISIEPNENWTIEELLNYYHDQSQTQVTNKANELIQALEQVYIHAEKDVWELHKLAIENNTEDNDTDPVESQEEKQQEPIEQVQQETKKSTRSRKQYYNLFIEVMTGPHEGATFLLKPRPSRSCDIGRSKGKKFTQRGVSLYKDSEVSTCHGKFEYQSSADGDKLFYTDTGSTNGTSFLGEAIEDHSPLEIIDGLVLGFGESDLKFTIVDN